MKLMTNKLDITQIENAQSWLADGHKVAIAIVTQSWGSSPRQAGAIMLIRDDHMISGSVSGGCIEGQVISEATTLFETRKPILLSEGVDDETAWSQGLSCGGQIDLVITLIDDAFIAPSLIEESAAIIAKRGEAQLVLNTQTGTARLESHDQPLLDDEIAFAMAPRKQLIIIGAGHISQHLAQMAQQTDFTVTVIDPRSLFITQARFPNCRLIDDWPETAFADVPLDDETALAVLTHDPRIDDQALIAGLHAKPFHIAALGSRRTHEKRQNRLLEQGFTKAEIARIKGPAGLAIGAASPAEIALSIMAEIISYYRGGNVR